jgi:hypothetical protein
MPELARAIQAVSEASDRAQAAEQSLDQARAELADALERAYKAGASYALLGRLVGLSRQRIAKILERD